MSTAEIGVIGGSGFYQLEELRDAERLEVETPFGAPSGPIVTGTIEGRRVAFIARHGEGHRLLPSEVPARANIHALKQLGAERVISLSAVGSLREEIEPLHAVAPDQIIDRTNWRRPHTFFGDGMVAHIGFADPFCAGLATALADAAEASGVTTHRGGALVVTEGPSFSTRAEARVNRAAGGTIIGMTAIPEARLAREAELCYAALCFVTDYDVWRDSQEDVSADMVLENLSRNAARGRQALVRTVAGLGALGDCDCRNALASALVTSPDLVPLETRRRLALLLRRYHGEPPDEP